LDRPSSAFNSTKGKAESTLAAIATLVRQVGLSMLAKHEMRQLRGAGASGRARCARVV
jgi:hypothetical protein